MENKRKQHFGKMLTKIALRKRFISITILYRQMKYWIFSILLIALLFLVGCSKGITGEAIKTIEETTVEVSEKQEPDTSDKPDTTIIKQEETTAMSRDDIAKGEVIKTLEKRNYNVKEVYISRSAKDGFFVGVTMDWNGKVDALAYEKITNGWLTLYNLFPEEIAYQVALYDENRRKQTCYLGADSDKLVKFNEWVKKNNYNIGPDDSGNYNEAKGYIDGLFVGEQWSTLFEFDYCENL